MLEKKQRLQYLLTQYVDQNISEKELKELFNEIAKEENKSLLYDFMKMTEKSTLQDAEAHRVDWDHIYKTIIDDDKATSRFSGIAVLVQRITIAAAVIAIVFIGYRFTFEKKQFASSEMKVSHDVSPGSEKAILKLSDGSSIVLNDAGNGILAKEGAVNISKTADDVIDYTANTASGDSRVYTNVLHTPRGGQYRLILPDKTLVWLNAESSITFPTAFTGRNREVQVTGEVYFEVSPDKNKPFIVSSRQDQIEVLGTHFNVNAYPDEDQTAVTLLEGSIRLNHGKNFKLIAPGQQATFHNEEESIKLTNVDTDNVVDWKNGLFIFENAPVKEVMRQIERWYDVEVRYAGKIPNVKFNGVINRSHNLSKLIKLLQTAGNISFEINNRTVTVKQLNQ